MERLTKSLEISSLPQTIRDAILTARRLGIKYLWLDPQCIIQDSALDKIHEIEATGGHYKSSTLMIVAATGSCLERVAPPKIFAAFL